MIKAYDKNVFEQSTTILSIYDLNMDSLKTNKNFKFDLYKQRHIALKILYFGWDLDGLSAQVDNENTVEYHLFSALEKTCLIQSRERCNYNRCGRTDKGVSSTGQVVDLDVRSNLIDEDDLDNIGLFTPENYCPSDDHLMRCSNEEIPYVDMLNRVLPDNIKVIAWAPVNKDFSSRFSCESRSYSYIFPRGNLDLKSMASALNYLLGEHDFRNVCSFDLKNGVFNHRRTITHTSISPIEPGDDSDELINPYRFFQVTITGQAFLYHQIRCIMSILFLIGSGKEKPETLRDILDIQKCPSRPNYNRADAMPLCLFDCEYKTDDIPLGWKFNPKSLKNLSKQLRNLWWRYKTKALMIERFMTNVEAHATTIDSNEVCSSNTVNWKDFGLVCDTMSDAKYVPLLKRPRDTTLEEKIEALKARKKK